MPTFKIDLDQETYNKLLAMALRERRPTQWQAEVLLKQAVLQEGSAHEPDPQGRLADSMENDAPNRNGPAAVLPGR